MKEGDTRYAHLPLHAMSVNANYLMTLLGLADWF